MTNYHVVEGYHQESRQFAVSSKITTFIIHLILNIYQSKRITEVSRYILTNQDDFNIDAIMAIRF